LTIALTAMMLRAISPSTRWLIVRGGISPNRRAISALDIRPSLLSRRMISLSILSSVCMVPTNGSLSLVEKGIWEAKNGEEQSV